MAEIAISAVTEGELLYGLARRSYPAGLTERVRQFLLRVDVLPWDREVARAYADLRASCEARGAPLAPLDMMRSEEHTSELQSLMRISYAVFCLKKKKQSTKSAHSI